MVFWGKLFIKVFVLLLFVVRIIVCEVRIVNKIEYSMLIWSICLVGGL